MTQPASYNPLQPSARRSENVQYDEVKPSELVASSVYCYWQLRSLPELTKDYHYKVVADGCIDIFFNTQEPSQSYVMGFCKKYMHFPLGHEFNFIGIRFHPGQFSQLFRVNAKKLSNRITSLENVQPAMAKYIANMSPSSTSLLSLAAYFNSFLGQCRREESSTKDQRFYDALQVIFNKKGRLETESELNTGLSPRQLRRIFNHHIGSTPKSFSKVVRFQSVVEKLYRTEGIPSPEIYLDAGFYDQAHFIKDFKRFYGVTPMEAYGDLN